MKLRIHGNAIRLRLNRREVSQFEATGTVGACLGFPVGRGLEYILETSIESGVSADFDGARIRVRIQQSLARDWTVTDQVGINQSCALPDGQRLEISVEKDFQCMHKGEEAKDPDAYSNPTAA